MENALLPSTNKKVIYTTLKIVIIILAILLLVLIRMYGFGDCDKLRFEVNNKSLNAGDFMEVYSNSCLNRTLPDSSSYYNFSGITLS